VERGDAIEIEEADENRMDAVWPIIREVAAESDTDSMLPTITFEEAKKIWFSESHRVFTASSAGRLVGTYWVAPNRFGLGSHVANAGYMVHPDQRGRGVASAMLEHSFNTARAEGYRAMQFNYVVSTNEIAVRLWKRHGFKEVGRVPQAFAHGRGDFVDVLIMHRFL